ncbi:MAG: amidase family protein [Pseudomonadota bacterium]
MTSTPLWQLSAVEQAEGIRAGTFSATEAVEAAIARLDEVNPTLNAVTMDLRESAMEAAAAADQRRADGDQTLGPLHGVPVTIKENIDQEGLANTNGLPALADQIAPADSPVAANLRKAGAIVIGRTNTPEFSYRWFTDNPLRGRTLNPWDANVTPGGSSGGAASAVATGVGAIAHGNDLGGSLRYPAYACGVATIKPGLGRIAAYNPSSVEERPPTLQLMSVQGPIAREMRDVRLAFEVMAAADPRDPWWVPAPLRGPELAGPIRVAMTHGPHDQPIDPGVATAIQQAADHLSNAGFAVEAVDPPHIEEAAERWRQLIGADTREMMMPAIREYGSERLNELAGVFGELSDAYDLATYMRLSADRTRLWREWAEFMQDYPLVLAPVSQVPPFPQGADEQGALAYRELVAQQAMLYVINLLGLPSAAVPTGLHENVPMGVQLIGPRFREDLCMDAAERIEDAVGVLARELWSRN